MEAEIALDSFLQPETMHGLRYKWLIGDSDSSVCNAIQHGVITYGQHVDKVESANHTSRCYRNCMEDLCKHKTDCNGRDALTNNMMRHGAQSDI